MILEEIVAHKRNETAERKERVPVSDLIARAELQPAAIDLTTSLRGEGVSLIAEIKRASPSKGSFAVNLQAESTASIYASNGAKAISVLTDERYFRGSMNDLLEAKKGVAGTGRSIPILRKDFILDPYQVVEA
ncbi:indole-3-glycerol-phosphate synthase TrpC, partial [Candidatus Bipolaricaulota bacterium]|nr:indole-3-glycerol-phosphate synthase TrpC [Candidatus Bipolaricaulota bacterium]